MSIGIDLEMVHRARPDERHHRAAGCLDPSRRIDSGELVRDAPKKGNGPTLPGGVSV
jgi:hypothetical protein